MNFLIKNKFWEINKEYNKEKLLYLLIDRPDHVDTSNNFYWFNNEKPWHRNYDLPAIIGKIGYASWWKNNKRHREKSKPAYIFSNGQKEYWLHGKPICFC